MAIEEVAPLWSSLHIHRDDLGVLEPFDQGGEGVLYTVSSMTGPYGQPLLFKEYRPGTVSDLDGEALERLTAFTRSLDRDMLAWLYHRAAWPAWIIQADNSGRGQARSVGVLMPLASVPFMAALPRSSGGTRVVPAKFELLLNGGHFLENVGIEISMRQRIQLLSSVAETLAFLHAHSIAVGDFSCKNVLFALRPTPSCFFIDCDSTSQDGVSALPPGETPEWELPDGEQLGTRAADVYKFALLVLRMHTGAQHHRNPARLPDSTWGPLRGLVERAIGSPPSGRPLITEWTGPLLDAAGAASTRTSPSRVGAPGPVPPPVSPGVSGPSPPRVTMVAPARFAARPGDPGPHGNGSVPLPSGPTVDFIIRLLRRLLVRRPANPSLRKLVVMLFGLWAACAATFGVAVLAGMSPRHMSSIAEFVLFGIFVVLAFAAFALATTEPE